jgi:dUTP pyrophosphatase
MAKDTTPPPESLTASSAAIPTSHEPPSLPASPLPKRPKTTATATAANSSTDGTQKNLPPTLPSLASVMAAAESHSAAVTTQSQQTPALLIKKLTDTARAPTRGSAFAAGYDLYSAKDTVIPLKGKALVDTGIAIAVPEGTCMYKT